MMKKYWLALGLFSVLSCVLFCSCNKQKAPDCCTEGLSENAINQMFQHALELKNTDTDSALAVLEYVHQVSVNTKFHKGVVNSLLAKGMILLNTGSYEKSIQANRYALKYAEQYSKNDLGLINNNLGLAHMYQSNYDSAAAFFQKAILYMKEWKQPATLIILYNNLANIYSELNQKTDALRYIEAAEKIYKNISPNKEDSIHISYVYVTKGSMYLDYEMFDNAEMYFNLALSISKTVDYKETQLVALTRLGELYLNKKLPEQAIAYFKEALKTKKGYANIHDYYSYLEPSYLLAKAYYETGDFLYAENVLTSALHHADSSGSSTDRDYAHNLLSQVYEKMQLPWKALEEYKKYTVLRDSFFNIKKQKIINQLETRYRTAEKDKELIQQQLTISHQQNKLYQQKIWLFAISAFMLFAFILFGSIFRNVRQRQKLQAERILTLEREQEIIQLKAMAKGEEKERARLASELHDGIAGQLAATKMNFSAIQHQHQLEYIAEYEEALEQLGDAVEEVRKTAHNLMPDVLLQGGLFLAIEHFCNKMSKHLNIDFQYYGTSPKLDAEFELTIYRIVQELLHNITKHAEADNVLVQLNCTQEMLNMTIEDDGRGIGDTHMLKEKGTGLKNIAARVKSFNGQMLIDSEPMKGTTVYIEFDIAHATPSTIPLYPQKI